VASGKCHDTVISVPVFHSDATITKTSEEKFGYELQGQIKHRLISKADCSGIASSRLAGSSGAFAVLRL